MSRNGDGQEPGRAGPGKRQADPIPGFRLIARIGQGAEKRGERKA